MNELKIRSNLSLNLEKMTILLFDQEIGYISSYIYDGKETIDIFIEEEYRFHHYALDTLSKYFNYTFKNNDVECIEFFIDNDNRAGLNMMGYFPVTYCTFDEETNEHIYFLEKSNFYSGKKEKEECFDTYDKNLNKLDMDFPRGSTQPLGYYHIVTSIVLINEENKILVTLRDPNKTYPFCYEITSGSMLKGETKEEGAIREIKEETNISLNIEDLKYFGKLIIKDTIFIGYVAYFRSDNQHIILQEGETIDYTFVTFEEFAQLIENKHFSPVNRKLLNATKKELNDILKKKIEN